MRRPVKGIAFVALMLGAVSVVMAAPPVITITAPASENESIANDFTFTANIIETVENLTGVYFNFTNSSSGDPVNSSGNLVNPPYTGTSSSGASFSYVLNTPALADGNYMLSVTATNENITDNSSSATRNFTIKNTLPDTLPDATPANYIPPAPILSSAQQNFWINYTWQAGAGNVTNSYNVSVNDVWTNGTTAAYNNTEVGPHGWSNITVWAYNNSGSGSLSLTPDFQNMQLENNKPIQNPIGDQTINEGDLLTFTVSATDADYDTVTYGTNATEGTFNPTTGRFSWTPNYGDAGVYVWYFNSSDSRGGVASETIKVTVNDVPLTITSLSPLSNPTTIVGTSQQFEINLNRTANVTWYIEGYAVQNNVTVISASYTNSTAAIGVYNVTATASDGYDVNSKTWIWTVAPEPRYNVSGYVFDNYGAGLGGVQVQNGINQNTTIASGYYLITGMLNGTYNFSYSKAGFATGYLEVMIIGADNTGANIRIYDTTPPLSVSNPDTSAAVGSFFINNSWVNPSDADFNHTWFRYSNGTDLENVSTPNLNLTWQPHYTQNISAQTVDKYGNVNQTKVWFNATIPNNPIQIKDIQDSYHLTEGQTLTIDANYTDIDNDTGIFDRNFSQGNFDTSTGILSWKTKSRNKGIYYWQINVSDKPSVDTEPSVAAKNFIVFVSDSTPTSPQNLQNTTGNFWINWTWTAGNNADDYDVWINGSDLGTDITGLFYNGTYSAHAQMTFSVRTHNHTLDSYSEWINQTTTIPNNNAILSNISSSYIVFENNPVSIYPTASDLDRDTLTFGSNITKGTFYPNNGTFLWTPNSTEGGIIYNWYISVSDGYGTNTTYFTVNVIDSTPAEPQNFSYETGNFWVNYTWEKGANTDSFNIWNGTWTNGTNLYFNTTVGQHNWSNITVYAYNASSWQMSSGVAGNARVPNNVPSIPAKVAPVNWQNLSNGNVRLSWEKSRDEDGDNITYDWQLSDQPDFSTALQSGNTENLNADLSLPPSAYYWKVRANDSLGLSNWSQSSATPDFQIVSAPSIDNVRANIITNDSIKIDWATNQSDSLNIVKYGYNPDLSDGSFSSWSNNTNNPTINIDGLAGQSVYYQAFSYNAGNSSANSISAIYNFNYPLQVSLYYIEPAITNDNETWRPASRGHIGKFIGIDGNFNNIGEDSLVLTITAINKNKYSGPFTVTLAKYDNKSFMETSLGRHAFEIDSNGVNGGFFNSTLQINVTGQNGTNFIFNYTNITTISLKLNPIFKIKRAIDGEGKETGEGRAIVSRGSTTTIKYILEANSSVNLTGVVIYDPFYPANQGGPFFNIQELKANEPKNVSYTYKATTSDLSSNKCEDLTPCIINLATFRGDIEPSGEPIYDSDYVRIRVFPYTTNSVSSSSGGGGGSSGGGGGMPPSEDFKNIERREVREMDIIARSAATYVFKTADPVMAVAFESSVSENGVPVALEVLNNRSKFIGVDAPGKPYKYFNVFVGMSGFSKKVSNGVLVFRVNNSWLEENDFDPKDVSLYKWQGNEWIGKETKIADSKPNYTYYASAVGNFSSFAVGAQKAGSLSSSMPAMPDIPLPPVQLPVDGLENHTINASANQNLSGFKLTSILAGILGFALPKGEGNMAAGTLKLLMAITLIFGMVGIMRYYLKMRHIKINGRMNKRN